ncbi:MAG: phosphoribosylformylglycinamidine synthase, partial [Gammaproteobacteria bacterium]|nr:phosphoribosylformylglycinamidine synthase [Gammaproteobacteria bacterium]
TGRGAKPKAGLTGFSVSNLHIPGLDNNWACESGKPGRIASALDIMIEGPIGAASFNNEFGRPALGGYFRTFEQNINGRLWGYHKPIMVAGGMGNIRPQHVEKHELQAGDAVFVLGGPAMLIGLGGGAASSLGSGQSDLQLDFASVQRGNPEMQRRCQEVIDSCWAMDDQNPLVSIHDVGAGGLSNALPELLNDSQRGGVLELRRVPSADTAMSPMEIWCNEAQERYVMAVRPGQVDLFLGICKRERCPVALLGYATKDRKMRLEDELLGDAPVDVPMELMLGKPPKMHRDAQAIPVSAGPVNDQHKALETLVSEVLGHPTVGSKSFLITIGDRTVGGLVARDQMVGPWQVPVADAAVTLSGFEHFSGECMAIGERTPLAVVDGPASGRMAVGEAITNIACVPLAKMSDLRLSANWMAAAGEPGQDAVLFETVHAVGMELCPELGIAIPVGKDSMSLKTRWHRDDDPANEEISMIAPVSLVVSAFAPVADVRHSLTPQLRLNRGPSRLLLLDLGQGNNRLGGSIYAQLGQSFGNDVPDLDEAEHLKAFFSVIQRLNREGLLLAYHDRSDGGLIASLCEMAFAGRCGLRLDFDMSRENLPGALFAEELGAVIQVRVDDLKKVRAICRDEGIDALLQDIGRPQNGRQLLARCSGKPVLDMDLCELQLKWAETSLAIQGLRDHPECAAQEKAFLSSWEEPLLRPQVTFEVQAPAVLSGDRRPSVAILREQGVNGQVEMAAAFDMAGFRAVDVHMTDLIDGQTRLDTFQGFVACGGFSYGDVLGAGRGWASSILFRDALGEQFSGFLS